MDASAPKPKTKQLIIHASVQQEDLDRLRWLSERFNMNRSAVIRKCIRTAYEEAQYVAAGGGVRGENQGGAAV